MTTLYYDVIVVGGGHAGCEAARAAARMGARTCLVTMDMNKIGQMSCNPAVGGIAKGQIVREVDALGGGMGIVTDATAIQFRMLNRSKGPAMWSPRAQCDRGKFIWKWRELLDHTDNLDIWQDQVEELLVSDENNCNAKPNATGIPTRNDCKVTPNATGIPTIKDCNAKPNATGIPTLNNCKAKPKVIGVRTIWGVEIHAPAVVITAGTFLNGLMHVGRKMVPGGRCAEPASLHLTESINALGISSERMKTGTPVRIDKRSVHFEDTEVQPGEDTAQLFSYMPLSHSAATVPHCAATVPCAAASVPCTSAATIPTAAASVPTAAASVPHSAATVPDGCPSGTCGCPSGTCGCPSGTTASPSGASASPALPQLPCYTFTTNPECHETLLRGLPDSPLYNGQIQSIGPRYCPSVETKLITFPDRTHHPLFLEPEGTDTNEMYLNGFSSSMPIDIQLEALRKIPALRDMKVYRPGYAIEYDFFDPTQLNHSLMSKKADGLFFAGQVNGTTGYEEAAGQGIVAGINAAKYAGSFGSDTQWSPFTLGRDEAYIGVLIDDLVTKGVDEPYRMFTSRAEYRILLRQDDADARLTERSYNLGLASAERYQWWLEKKKHIDSIVEYAHSANISPRDVNTALESIGSTPLQHGCKLRELISRPGVTIQWLAESLPQLKTLITAPSNRNAEITEAAEIKIKYQGYIEREHQAAEKMHRLENIRIRGHFDYNTIQSLSTEARQKLTHIDPETLAQASRIPGVSPNDISVLLVLMGR